MSLPVLVTSYIDPDLDSVACTLAYVEWLEQNNIRAIGGIFGHPQDEAQYILDRFNIPVPQPIINPEQYESIILVDSSKIPDLPEWLQPERVIEIIDHRQVNDAEKFPRAKTQIELVGAAATLIAERFATRDVNISASSALALYAAIVSNTFNFQSGTTTPRDRTMAQWLSELCSPPKELAREMFLAKSDVAGDILARKIEGNFTWLMLGGYQVGLGTIEMIGAEQVVHQRQEEIMKVLASQKKQYHLDYNLLSLVEIDGGYNIFLTEDLDLQTLLTEILQVSWFHNVGKRKGLLLRKEIIPLLKKRLEEGGM